MKVLHINFSFTIGGIDNMMIDIMKHQLLKGVDVCLMIINDRVDKDVYNDIPKGVKVFLIRRPPSSKNVIYICKIYWLINARIRPNVIHCHNSKLGGLLRFDRHPKLLTVHDVGYLPINYNCFDWIVAISKSVKRDVTRLFPTCRISTIYNGIDFSLIETKDDYDTTGRSFRIVIVSRLEYKKKGHDLLIEAIQYVRSKLSDDISLDIIGEGESRLFLENKLRDLNLSKSIRFLGGKKRCWIYHNLKNYDLLVQPSRYEGFGLTVVEGVAAKIPVLASDIDGPCEILSNGKCGYLFHSDNLQSLCDVLLIIIQMSPDKRKEKAYRDYDNIRNRFSIEKTAQEYVDLYSSLIKK